MQTFQDLISNVLNYMKNIYTQKDYTKKNQYCQFVTVNGTTLDLFNKYIFEDNKLIFGKYFIKTLESYDFNRVCICDLRTEKILKTIYGTKHHVICGFVTNLNLGFFNSHDIYSTGSEITNDENICLQIEEVIHDTLERIYTFVSITKFYIIKKLYSIKCKSDVYLNAFIANNKLLLRMNPYSSTIIINMNTLKNSDYLKPMFTHIKTIIKDQCIVEFKNGYFVTTDDRYNNLFLGIIYNDENIKLCDIKNESDECFFVTCNQKLYKILVTQFSTPSAITPLHGSFVSIYELPSNHFLNQIYILIDKCKIKYCFYINDVLIIASKKEILYVNCSMRIVLKTFQHKIIHNIIFTNEYLLVVAETRKRKIKIIIIDHKTLSQCKIITGSKKLLSSFCDNRHVEFFIQPNYLALNEIQQKLDALEYLNKDVNQIIILYIS